MQMNYTDNTQNCKDNSTDCEEKPLSFNRSNDIDALLAGLDDDHGAIEKAPVRTAKIIPLSTADERARLRLKATFASSPRLQRLLEKNCGQQVLDSVLDRKEPAPEEPRAYTNAELAEVDQLLAAALSDERPVEYITDGATIRMIKSASQPDPIERPVTSAKVFYLPGVFEQPRHAPAARPPALLGLKPLTDATMRQYQTLDVEYLHTSGHRKPLVITGEFRKRYAKHVALAERLQDLMQSPTLDADAVAAFVTLPVPFAVKAEILGLTERQQHGLLAICSDRQRKRYKATHERASEALATIQRKTKANHAHLVSDRFLVWQCRQLTGGQAMEVAHLRELAGGPKADRSNAAGALKTLAKIGV